jgi:hypothetical protein
VEFGDCGGGVFKRPAQGIGDFARYLLVEFEGRRGWLRIGEPGGGCGGWCISSRAFVVCGVYCGEGFHGGKYTTGWGALDVTPQPIAILLEK